MFRLGIGAIIAWFVFVATILSAYVTHIVWAVKTLMGDATGSQIVLSVAGSLLPPIGILHGFVLWF